MSLDIWNKFTAHKNDIHYLTKLITETSFMQLQVNLITLKLCIKRDNLDIPNDLWKIICRFIENDIRNLKPKQIYYFVCPISPRFKYGKQEVYSQYPPKYCECHNAKFKAIYIFEEGHYTKI